MIIKNRTYENQKVELDGNEFTNCVFRNCEYNYYGGKPPKLINCTFHGRMGLNFGGGAGNTIELLKAFYSYEGFRPFVDNVINVIQGKPQEQFRHTDWTDIIE